MRDTGKCEFGDKCHYSHDPAAVAKAKKEMKVNAQKEKAATEKTDAAVNAQAKGKGKGKGSSKGQGKKKDDKDRLCGYSKKGEDCPYGKECKYSHNKKAFNADGTKKAKGSNSQTPAVDAGDDWGKPVGLKSNVCGYAKAYPEPFSAVVSGQPASRQTAAKMVASAAVVKPAACSIKALSELPEDWWTLTESDTGGYQYQTDTLIMGVPIRTLLDGCAGVNSITEEAVIGALNLAKSKGLKASDPSFPVVQLERWKRKEVITGVRKGASDRIVGAAVLRVGLLRVDGKPGSAFAPILTHGLTLMTTCRCC